MLRLLLLLAALALPGPLAAQDRPQVERQFRGWLEQNLWPRARADGVSRAVFEAAFSGVSLDWDLPDLVPPGASGTAPRRQRQAEFASPGAYFRRG
ncbi:lytic murein transglycosylase, partial [Limimaricola sp. ASW11-118]|nr:lytic murein transglycosylase [Limimaricola litoreus]